MKRSSEKKFTNLPVPKQLKASLSSPTSKNNMLESARTKSPSVTVEGTSAMSSSKESRKSLSPSRVPVPMYGVRYITDDMIKKQAKEENMKLITHLNLNLSKDIGMKKIKYIEGLDQLHQLQTLNLSNNMIEKMEKMDKLLKLRVLNLSSNCIYKIEGLENLILLQTLDLTNNKIEQIPSWLPKKLKALRVFRIAENRLDSLSEISKLKSLSDLHQLDYGKNPLVELPHHRLFIIFQLCTVELLDGHQVSREERKTAQERFAQEEMGKLEQKLEVEEKKNKNLEETHRKSASEISVRNATAVQYKMKDKESREKIKDLEQELKVKEDLLKKKTTDLTKASEKHYQLEQELAFFKIDSKFDSLGKRPLVNANESGDDGGLIGESPYIGKARYSSNQYAQESFISSPHVNQITRQTFNISTPDDNFGFNKLPSVDNKLVEKQKELEQADKKLKALMDDLEWTEKKLLRATAEMKKMTKSETPDHFKGDEKFKIRQRLARKMSNVTKLRDMATQVESEIDRKQQKIQEDKKQLGKIMEELGKQPKENNQNYERKQALKVDKEQQINESNEVYKNLKVELEDMMDNIDRETEEIKKLEQQLREDQIENNEEMRQELDDVVNGLQDYIQNIQDQTELQKKQCDDVTREKNNLQDKVKRLEQELRMLNIPDTSQKHMNEGRLNESLEVRRLNDEIKRLQNTLKEEKRKCLEADQLVMALQNQTNRKEKVLSNKIGTQTSPQNERRLDNSWEVKRLNDEVRRLQDSLKEEERKNIEADRLVMALKNQTKKKENVLLKKTGTQTDERNERRLDDSREIKRLNDKVKQLQNNLKEAEQKHKENERRLNDSSEVKRLNNEIRQLQNDLNKEERKQRQNISASGKIRASCSESSEKSSLYSDEKELYEELQRELMELKRFMRNKMQEDERHLADMETEAAKWRSEVHDKEEEFKAEIERQRQEADLLWEKQEARIQVIGDDLKNAEREADLLQKILDAKDQHLQNETQEVDLFNKVSTKQEEELARLYDILESQRNEIEKLNALLDNLAHNGPDKVGPGFDEKLWQVRQQVNDLKETLAMQSAYIQNMEKTENVESGIQTDYIPQNSGVSLPMYSKQTSRPQEENLIINNIPGATSSPKHIPYISMSQPFSDNQTYLQSNSLIQPKQIMSSSKPFSQPPVSPTRHRSHQKDMYSPLHEPQSNSPLNEPQSNLSHAQPLLHQPVSSTRHHPHQNNVLQSVYEPQSNLDEPDHTSKRSPLRPSQETLLPSQEIKRSPNRELFINPIQQQAINNGFIKQNKGRSIRKLNFPPEKSASTPIFKSVNEYPVTQREEETREAAIKLMNIKDHENRPLQYISQPNLSTQSAFERVHRPAPYNPIQNVLSPGVETSHMIPPPSPHTPYYLSHPSAKSVSGNQENIATNDDYRQYVTPAVAGYPINQPLQSPHHYGYQVPRPQNYVLQQRSRQTNAFHPIPKDQAINENYNPEMPYPHYVSDKVYYSPQGNNTVYVRHKNSGRRIKKDHYMEELRPIASGTPIKYGRPHIVYEESWTNPPSPIRKVIDTRPHEEVITTSYDDEDHLFCNVSEHHELEDIQHDLEDRIKSLKKRIKSLKNEGVKERQYFEEDYHLILRLRRALEKSRDELIDLDKAIGKKRQNLREICREESQLKEDSVSAKIELQSLKKNNDRILAKEEEKATMDRLLAKKSQVYLQEEIKCLEKTLIKRKSQLHETQQLLKEYQTDLLQAKEKLAETDETRNKVEDNLKDTIKETDEIEIRANQAGAELVKILEQLADTKLQLQDCKLQRQHEEHTLKDIKKIMSIKDGEYKDLQTKIEHSTQEFHKLQTDLITATEQEKIVVDTLKDSDDLLTKRRIELSCMNDQLESHRCDVESLNHELCKVSTELKYIEDEKDRKQSEFTKVLKEADIQLANKHIEIREKSELEQLSFEIRHKSSEVERLHQILSQKREDVERLAKERNLIQERISALKQEKDMMSDSCKTFDEKMKQLKRNHSDMEDKIEDKSNRLDSLDREIQQKEKEMGEYIKQKNSLIKETQSLQHHLKESKEVMKKMQEDIVVMKEKLDTSEKDLDYMYQQQNLARKELDVLNRSIKTNRAVNDGLVLKEANELTDYEEQLKLTKELEDEKMKRTAEKLTLLQKQVRELESELKERNQEKNELAKALAMSYEELQKAWKVKAEENQTQDDKDRSIHTSSQDKWKKQAVKEQQEQEQDYLRYQLRQQMLRYADSMEKTRLESEVTVNGLKRKLNNLQEVLFNSTELDDIQITERTTKSGSYSPSRSPRLMARRLPIQCDDKQAPQPPEYYDQYLQEIHY
ncbi:centriolin [Patella vulgata]|uniref:centriolin n=1 Tax=Patella vulgata TaxID=6465 RepID=UPI00217F57DC|nr:centriolin [Patella vulgata]